MIKGRGGLSASKHIDKIRALGSSHAKLVLAWISMVQFNRHGLL